MKYTRNKFSYIRNFFTVLFTLLLSNTAVADSDIIRCKTADGKNFRIWKLSKQNGVNLWTLHNKQFYPFCSNGLSIQFSNGLLCAFNKDQKIGTVATFINIEKPEITDILIRENTILKNPRTWDQKIKTDCELIRE